MRRDANNRGKPVNRLVNDLNYGHGRSSAILVEKDTI